jgi:cytoskeletal protein CcmA (bactofilin family)
MKSTHGRLLGPTVFREDTIHHGMVTGGVTVASGIALHFYGMIAGDLNIEPGATVDMHGFVAGSVFNQGNLTLEGNVAGSVSDNGGTSVIRSDSAVG